MNAGNIRVQECGCKWVGGVWIEACDAHERVAVERAINALATKPAPGGLPGALRFDGCGINNREGRRLFTASRADWDSGELQGAGRLIEGAAELVQALAELYTVAGSLAAEARNGARATLALERAAAALEAVGVRT